MKKALLISVGVLFSTLFFGQIIHVPADYASIQDAINAANPNDTVLVDPGVYYEHILVPNKALVIGSLFLTTQDADYIAQTIIDGSNSGRVFYIVGTNEFITLSGFTVQNGYTSGNTFGGGIYIQAAINLTLTDLIVKSNIATQGGGVGFLWYTSARILNTIFSNNQGVDDPINYVNGEGGAVYARSANLTFVDCHFENNTASLGGAISEVEGNHTFLQCSFRGNSAIYLGEAIASFGGQNSTFEKCSFENHPLGAVFEPWEANLTITNCLIANNKQIITSSNTGDEIKIISSTIVNNQGGDYSIYLSHENEFYMTNSIFWNSGTIHLYMNNEVSLSHVILDRGLESIYSQGTGNSVYASGSVFDANPYFIDSLDYHLADYSPAIGAGADSVEMTGMWFYSPLTDLENNPRPGPEGSYPDIGAFENPLGLPVGIANQALIVNSEIQIFPNPASNSVQLKNIEEQSVTKIIFYDQLGHQVRQIDQPSEKIDVSGFSKGIYVVVIATDNGRTIKKLLIN